MGIAATSSRMTQVRIQQSHLQYAMTQVTDRRKAIMVQSSEAESKYPELAQEYKKVDKDLEAEMLKLQNMEKMVNEEYDFLKKILDQNIEKGMKYNA